MIYPVFMYDIHPILRDPSTLDIQSYSIFYRRSNSLGCAFLLSLRDENLSEHLTARFNILFRFSKIPQSKRACRANKLVSAAALYWNLTDIPCSSQIVYSINNVPLLRKMKPIELYR